MAINQFIEKIVNIKKADKNDMTSQMIIRMRKKDINPFLAWMEVRRDQYYKMAWAYLHNHYDIEDVFQISIMKVYENIYQLREDRYFETWFTSIFLNQCRSMIRKKKREVMLEKIDEMEYIHNLHIEESGIGLKENLDKLEDLHKEVIILKYICGYSQEEIGEILQIPIGTVKSRIYRGLKLLKQQIEKEV